MEICIGGSRYEDVRSAAYWCKNSLDKKPRYFDAEDAAHNYEEFLAKKLKNPMQADIAMHEVIRRKPVKYPHHFESNITELEKTPHIDTLVKSVDEKILKIYPRSYGVRRTLIAEDRVSLNWEVKPKLKGLKKLMLKLKVSL